MAVDHQGKALASRRVGAGVLLALALALAACDDGQDPGVPAGDAPAQTSDTLGACPPGGPDATTPPAGCLGDDGRVQRP